MGVASSLFEDADGLPRSQGSSGHAIKYSRSLEEFFLDINEANAMYSDLSSLFSNIHSSIIYTIFLFLLSNCLLWSPRLRLSDVLLNARLVVVEKLLRMPVQSSPSAYRSTF